jgi:hypothetical protein
MEVKWLVSLRFWIYLREQFARVHARLNDNARRQAETIKRLGALERHIAAVRRDAVLDTDNVVNVRESVAALAECVERIERRLELA